MRLRAVLSATVCGGALAVQTARCMDDETPSSSQSLTSVHTSCVQQRCDVEQRVQALFHLYLSEPDRTLVDTLYSEDAEFDDPVLHVRGRDRIHLACVGRSLLLSDAAVESYAVQPPSAIDDPNEVTVWVNASFQLLGRRFPLSSAVRLRFDDDCQIVSQEDCWKHRETISRKTAGFALGAVSDAVRSVNASLLVSFARMYLWLVHIRGPPPS